MGSIRPNPDGRINKNRRAEIFSTEGRTEGPNMMIRPNNEVT